MATIVTMDSNGSALVAEPELVNESYFLDGTQPAKGDNNTAKGKPPKKDTPPRNGQNQHQQNNHVEVYMDKHSPMKEERSGLSSGTATTVPISDSDSSFITSERTNSNSSSTAKSSDLSSPNVGKGNAWGTINGPNSPYLNNVQTESSPVPDRRVSNVSFQDIYEDEDDFYNDQQPMCTPPNNHSKSTTVMETPTDGMPPPLRASDCKGTPPTTLYAAPPPESTHDNSSSEQGGGGPLLSPGAYSKEGGESLASSASYSASPAFALDGSAPQNSIPHHRPVLYSAIGSLETCGASSLKTMWNKPKQKGFQQQYDTSHLIAPQKRSRREAKQTADNSNQGGNSGAMPDGLTTQDRFGDSPNSNPSDQTEPATGSKPSPANSNMSTQKTPTTSHHESSLNSSLKSMQQKLDAAEQTKGTRSTSSDNKIRAPYSAQPTRNDGTQVASSMRKSRGSRNSASRKGTKSVKIDDASLQQKKRGKKPVEMFRPSCDAYTPRMERKKITYKPAEMRTPVQKMATTMGTLSRPNFRDALRRVAMLLRQHIVKIEQRFNSGHLMTDEGLFKMSMKDAFSEENFATPRYKCTVVRVPMARPGMIFGLKKIRPKYEIPTEEEIYEFAHQLFKTVQLSSECSIVCLIYIERLMEASKVPLLASTWKPIFMCGLLLASKVWQDLSSWNIEFASVYPQFSLDSINKLELQFLRMVKWDLYISSSLYAKYYFALRSLVEKPDFRQRYNRMVGGVDSVAASEALKIQKRTEQVKEEALMQLSRSM